MNNFLGSSKSNQYFFVLSAVSFHNTWLSFVEKIKIKFLLTSSGNPSCNPFQEACFCFQVTVCVTLEGVPKAVCDSKNCSKSWLRHVPLRKLNNDSERKPEQKLSGGCWNYLWNQQLFSKKQTKTLKIFFSFFTRQPENLKTVCACTLTASTDLIYKPSKIFICSCFQFQAGFLTLSCSFCYVHSCFYNNSRLCSCFFVLCLGRSHPPPPPCHAMILVQR